MSEVAPTAAVSALRDLEQLHIRRARKSSAALASYVLTDEITGLPIAMAPFHYAWHKKLDEHDRVILWGFVESGKSQQVTIARTLWDLGNNPNLRVVILCKTDELAQKTVTLIGKYIENNRRLRAVFPNLKRAKGQKWTQHELTVERDAGIRDPSVKAIAAFSPSVMGSRIDRLRIDDILDYGTAWSQTQRDNLWDWFMSSFEGRFTRGTKISAVGNVWHQDDILHRFARQSSVWAAYLYPAVRSDGTPVWPERWPLDRLMMAEEAMGSFEYARQLQCVARSLTDDSRFKVEWIKLAVKLGEGKELKTHLNEIPPGCSIYTGVDVSVGHVHSDLTCLFTILVHPNETREILNIESGLWDGPTIVDKIEAAHHAFGGVIIVENNGTQEFILQFTRKRSAAKVMPFTTGARHFNNPAFGVESIATEMANGKWIIPSERGRVHPEVLGWINELTSYNPSKHPGDRLMASFFAQQGAKISKPRGGSRGLDPFSR